MTLLLLLRPAKNFEIPQADGHDPGGHYLQDYRILTESEWKAKYLKKQVKQNQIIVVEESSAIRSPGLPNDRTTESTELENARARYLYAEYKTKTIQEKIDALQQSLAAHEMLALATEEAEAVARFEQVQKVIAALEARKQQEEIARVRHLAILEELDSMDTMLNLLLH
jgi:hypothetical protein